MSRDGMIRNRHGLRASKSAVDVKQLFHVDRQFAQSTHQAMGFKLDGIKSSGQVARLRQSLGDELRNFRRGGSFRQGLLRQTFLQRTAEESDAGKALPEAVMQVLANALLFAVADFEDVFLQSFAVSDL